MLLWLDIAIAVAGDRGKGERELMVMPGIVEMVREIDSFAEARFNGVAVVC